jgi:hypothetical protein
MKFISTTAIFFMLISVGLAQPKMEFESTVHDFGDIIEGTVAKHDFIFTNTGNQPLVIASVRASCGCTTPTWTTEPVMPGQRGTITVGYDSEGRPGSFNRSITVMSNAETQYLQIFIRGDVKRDMARGTSAGQLLNSPEIILEQSLISLGKVENGQRIPFQITVANKGKGDLVITGIRSACNCISWIKNPGPIKNGNKQILQMVYSPKDTGNIREEVVVYSNDLTNREIKFDFTAEVVDNISHQSIIKQNNVLKF